MQEELEKLPEHKPPGIGLGTAARILFLILAGAAIAWPFSIFTPALLNDLYRIGTGSKEPLTTDMRVAMVASAILGFIIGASVANLLLNLLISGSHRLGNRWEKMDNGDKVNLFLGVAFGIIPSALILLVVYQIFESWARMHPANFGLICLGVAIIICVFVVYALRSISEFLPWSRGKARGKRTGIKILDTNVIIDGRIYDVSRTGFLEGSLYVPGFVLDELQYIADSHDPLRRQRGRRGLEVLRHMQSEFQLELRAQDRLAPDLGDGVDSRLVRLARAMGADIVTNDFNLNRVAALQEVKVLNINDLALGLRPNVLPSESLLISVVREGNQPLQGIGYLEDGTMVVVENGKTHIGETLDVIVTQVIQTERGKMIFAEVPDAEPPETNGHESIRRRPTGRRG